MAALMFSRRMMCSKASFTVEVPAPDEPVTAMMGCLLDMALPLWLVWWGMEPHPLADRMYQMPPGRNSHESLSCGYEGLMLRRPGISLCPACRGAPAATRA